jgi:hypothetical protein
MAAARVFAVLADPTTHSAIGGTGWVQEAADRAPLTEVGQIFRMDIHRVDAQDGYPAFFGKKYQASTRFALTRTEERIVR